MTRFDTSPQALFDPGAASSYFDAVHRPELAFAPAAAEFTPVNAWYLAELSRLIYNKADDHGTFLESVGLRVRASFEQRGVQCGIVEGSAAEGGPFRVVVFRGTDNLKNWLTNLDVRLEPWRGGGRVHLGFRNALDRVWPEVEDCLSAWEGRIVFAGHSLGGALATLAASARPPDAVYTFGSPRVGDSEFARTLSDVRLFRVINALDMVTGVPPADPPSPFRHAGDRYWMTEENELVVEPQSEDAAKTGVLRFLPQEPGKWKELFGTFTQRFTDHAPVNYVARLERLMDTERRQ